MLNDWGKLAWSVQQLPAAVDALAAAAGLGETAAGATAGTVDAGISIERLAAVRGLEAVPVELAHAELQENLATAAPAIVRVTEAGDGGAARVGYLALASSDRRRVGLLTPAGRTVQVPLRALAERIAQPLAARPKQLVDGWLERAKIAPARRERAARRWLNLLLLNRPVEDVWLLRADPAAPFSGALRTSGVARRASLFLLVSLCQVALSLVAFGVIGSEVLRGAFSAGWLVAWALLLVTIVPLQVLSTWLGGSVGLALAMRLKQRLLCGALRIDPAVIRARGSGGLLAMVSESEAIERAGLDGTVFVVVSVAQLLGACVALSLGASGVLHALSCVCMLACLAAIGAAVVRRLGRWTEQRFVLSQRFVENLQGYRTRVVQGVPEEWHGAEDRQLSVYARLNEQLDRASHVLHVCATRGWLTLGLAGLLPGILQGATPERIALSLLGIVQAHQAFSTLGRNLGSLLAAVVAWRSVAPLFRAATERGFPGSLGLQPTAAAEREEDADHEPPVLELRAVSMRHAGASRPALQDCSLLARRGDRILLEGASGSGKSTFANVVTGVVRPTAGLVLLHGLDLPALGTAQWRAQIASAPQFHENHLLSASLAFNLLMGRAWPASPGDLEDAEHICRRLGLGPLLARMPSGLHQIVGETGWQLSHGERSRVFLARALLQRASVVVLDESFGALDPDTQQLCVEAARELAPSLIVIAHP